MFANNRKLFLPDEQKKKWSQSFRFFSLLFWNIHTGIIETLYTTAAIKS